MPKSRQKIPGPPDRDDVDDTAPQSWSIERIGTLKSALETIAAVAAGTAVIIAGIGHLALRQRAQLIGMPEGVLQDPTSEMALTGVVALWESAVRTAWALLAGHALSLVAWGCLAGAALSFWLDTRDRHAQRAFVAFTILAVCVMAILLANGLTYIGGKPSYFRDLAAGMHAWLTAPNGKAMRALALGLVLPMLLWSAAAARTSFRLVRTAKVGVLAAVDQGLRIAALAQVLLVVSLMPPLYAFARWGVDYPRVVRVDKTCDGSLATLVAAHKLDAWLVSRGDAQEVLVVQGPDRRRIVVTLLRSGGGRCSWITNESSAVGSAP